MPHIEVDEKVFQFLQAQAEPFVDTPNTVLHKLLFGDGDSAKLNADRPIKGALKMTKTMPTDTFVMEMLESEFSGPFKKFSPARYLFESESQLIYFQNFNKPSGRLWYRLRHSIWKKLTESQKESFVCLTNPSDRMAYIIPVPDIEKQLARAGWDRDNIEVNIDVQDARWTELDWNIKNYERSYP